MLAKTVSVGLEEDKENVVRESVPVEVVEIELKKSHVLAGGDVMPVIVAPTAKELEADEPLLQENPHRFVLFPIKYHEVRGFGDFRPLPVELCLCLGDGWEANNLGFISDLANVQEGGSILLDR